MELPSIKKFTVAVSIFYIMIFKNILILKINIPVIKQLSILLKDFHMV